MSPKDKTDSTQQERTTKIVALAVFFVVFIGALLIYANQSANPAASGQTIILTSAPLDSPTASPSPNLSENTDVTPVCFFNWATNDASAEHIEALNEAVRSAGFTDFDLLASAYGEDRICQRGDEIVSSSFLMMDISPTITLTVDSTDTATLGADIRQILSALQASETLPKINRLELNFADDADSLRWTARYEDAIKAIADETSDDDLFALGQG